MRPDLIIVTPVYLNHPDRFEYLKTTVASFYRCNLFKGKVSHKLIDDRSPLFRDELPRYCEENQISFLGSIDPASRRGFFDVLERLVQSIDTEVVLYLEPDHYFYLEYDFVTPILKLFTQLPELAQVYLRGPLYFTPFQRRDPETLLTHDGTVLRRVVIDQENSGWVGKGRVHESFSFMPSFFRTEQLRGAVVGRFIAGGPADVEAALASEWQQRKLVGYLNAQAFCYHIGAAGKEGPGGYLDVGDKKYESVWSKKQL